MGISGDDKQDQIQDNTEPDVATFQPKQLKKCQDCKQSTHMLVSRAKCFIWAPTNNSLP